jgi:hypothetical protein
VPRCPWSRRLERGVTPPPKDIGILANWAAFFGLTGQENQDFFDRAALSRRELPEGVASDERVLSVLPAFFRAVWGKALEGEELTQFIENVRALHSPAKNGRNEGKGVGLGTR